VGILEHQAAVAQSEQIRSQQMGPNYLPNNSGVPQAPGVPVAPLPQNVVRQIKIDHYGRLRASAMWPNPQTNGKEYFDVSTV
jgi:hypothetical protein